MNDLQSKLVEERAVSRVQGALRQVAAPSQQALTGAVYVSSCQLAHLTLLLRVAPACKHLTLRIFVVGVVPFIVRHSTLFVHSSATSWGIPVDVSRRIDSVDGDINAVEFNADGTLLACGADTCVRYVVCVLWGCWWWLSFVIVVCDCCLWLFVVVCGCLWLFVCFERFHATAFA